MADEARQIGLHDKLFVETAEATVSPYDLYQAPTGEAGVYLPNPAFATSIATGRPYELTTRGKFTVLKTSGIVILKGGRVYWDHSANTATYKKVHDRDFYCGRASKDSGSGQAYVEVDLNIDPPYDLDLMRDPCDVITTGTQALGGFLPLALQKRGGAVHAVLSSTNEAQIISWNTVDGFAASTSAANAIVEFAFRVVSDGAGTVVDASLGVANGAHATDMDSQAESVLCHLDANNTNINFESDDGSTEVAATDSTTDYTEGSTTAVREEVWFDMRDPSDVQIYRNAVLMLPSTTFAVQAATGPWKLIFHVEKTSAADTYEIALDWMRARYAEQ